MRQYFKKTGSGLLLSVLLITCSNLPEKKTDGKNIEELVLISDSAEVAFQNIIDSTYDLVFSFNELMYVEQKLGDSADFCQEVHKFYSDSIIEGKTALLSRIIENGNHKINESIVALDNWKKRQSDWEEIIKTKTNEEALCRESLKKTQNLITQKKPVYDSLSKLIEKKGDTLLGRKSFKFKNNIIEAYIAKKGVHDIYIDVNEKAGFSFDSFQKYLAGKKKGDIVLITNGGMFKPDFSAQGLLVSESKEKSPLDTMTNKFGNFYIMPNGVFLVDSDSSFKVMSTKAYKVNCHAKKKLPKFATQSGPMLVVDGKINSKLSLHSENLNVRSGVGVMKNGRAVFIISSGKINFYDLALIFKDYFNCENALYLDGAISQMYFKGQQHIPNGSFGPMIGITQKK